MCLVTLSKKSTKAKTDIDVFKGVVKTDDPTIFSSPFFHKYFKVNGVTKNPIKMKELVVKTTSGEKIYMSVEGLHSWSRLRTPTLTEIDQQIDVVVLKAVIPKGARYYYNETDGQYVSDTLVVTNEEMNTTKRLRL